MGIKGDIEYRNFDRPSGSAPSEVLLPDKQHLVLRDQGDEGASVAFAVAAAIDYMRSEHGIHEPVSTRMLYEMGKRHDELASEEHEGTSIEGVLRGWSMYGVCPEELWQYDPRESGEPSEQAARVALENRPGSVFRLRTLRHQWLWALQQAHAIVVAADTHRGWDRPREEGSILHKPQWKKRGRHVFAVVGYTEQGFIVQNSWGKHWGGLRVGRSRYPGLALWEWQDFEENVLEGWMALLPGAPDTESERAFTRTRAGYRSDDFDEQEDCFDVAHDVESLCMVTAARDVKPPLSIGLFGDWGVGKSFFIREMKRRTAEKANIARNYEAKRGQEGYRVEPAYWSEIVQIEFNAWHYMDANLWASLIVRIFDELARHVAGESGSIAVERGKLFELIESANAELQLLRLERSQLDTHLNEARGNLIRVDDQIGVARNALSALNLTRIAVTDWNRRVSAHPKLREAVDSLGLPAVVESFSDLRGIVDKLRSTAGKGSMRLSALLVGGRPVVRAVFIVAILAVGAALPYLASEFDVSRFAGEIGQYATWVAGLFTGGGALLKKVNSDLSQVIDNFEAVESAATETDELKRQRETAQSNIKELEASRSTTSREIDQHEQKLTDLASRVEDLAVGRRLYNWIKKKVESSDYREKLGIVADVRADLQVLTDLLATSSKRKRDAWKEPLQEATRTDKSVLAKSDVAEIDRIVLYIDDLDRCPPERVVEVLQAVHLLLAFNLFVVVVAVDSRWLLRSLEKEYPDFLVLDQQKASADQVVSRRTSTPQDYLEKIFQIAFTIRPMAAGGFRRLMDDVVGAPTTVDGTNEESGRGVEETAGTGKDDGGMPAKNRRGGSGIREVAKRPDHLAKQDTTSDKQLAIDPNPEQLRISETELEFMKSLHAFLRTPRAAKRFANTYRLCRASLWAGELRSYTAAGSDDPIAVMVLLAILIGMPEEAVWIFTELGTKKDMQTFSQFLKELKPRKVFSRDSNETKKEKPSTSGTEHATSPGLRKLLRYQNGFCDNIHPTAEPRWRRLQETLERLPGIGFKTVEPLRKWVQPVSRFGFHPFHFDASLEASVETE